jgi:hypothetical protein
VLPIVSRLREVDPALKLAVTAGEEALRLELPPLAEASADPTTAAVAAVARGRAAGW